MIIVGRFLGFVRPLTPFIAGASRMPLRRFLPYDVLAAGAWAITFCTLGFLFWRSIDQLTTYVSRGLFALGTLVALIGGIVALIHLRRSPEARAKVRDWIDERDDRPGWRSLAKISRPVWHMVAQARRGGRRLHRPLRPGPRHPGQPRPRADDAARAGRASARSRSSCSATSCSSRASRGSTAGRPTSPTACASDVLVDVAKVVTDIGSSPVTARAARWPPRCSRALRRRPIEAVALVAGWLLVFAAVHFTKIAYDRAAPAGALVDTFNAAYPSGHSAYAVALVACATVLVRAGVGWAVRIAAVTVAVILVAVVAVTRVYLRAHYLTDVLGGIALASRSGRSSACSPCSSGAFATMRPT